MIEMIASVLVMIALAFFAISVVTMVAAFLVSLVGYVFYLIN